MGELSNMKLEEMKKYKLRHLKYYMMDSIKMEKLKNSMLTRSRAAGIRMWIMWITSVVLLFACAMQLLSLGHTWAPKVFVRLSSSSSSSLIMNPPRRSRVYESNGYLMVSSNGGLNQMRSGICDMVAIARYLNATLIVPELDKTSFWNDKSQFADIFDVDYFINSLQDQLQILKELPLDMKKKRVDSGQYLSMPPVSWSNMTYYHNIILPRLKNYTVLHFQKTDCRLANNGIPLDIQKFRCRVNYNSIRFVPAIEHLGKKIISILKQRGQFLVLHLRYEMDMLAFSGCVEGLNQTEVEELTAMRYAYPWWKEKAINGTQKRSTGACPLTPDETALTLKALGVDPNIQIYIAAGEIYGGERRLDGLRREFPNLVKKETLLPDSDLLPFKNHSSRMAALDYLVAIESDIFVPTYGGNMAKVVEGHRRFLGYRTSINLNKVELVKLIDQYKEGSLTRDKFSILVKLAHADRMGTPIRRIVVPRKPKEEDYFYTNPQECLPDFDGDNDDF